MATFKQLNLTFDQIDQESRDILRRLGIDREKERKILLKRYNKRTRVVLADSELIDYLLLLRKMEMSELNDRQQLFCKYYVASNNATASYQQAYHCSYESAIANGSRLLTKDNIKAYIQELKDIEQADRLILISQLRDENLESIKSNLASAKILREICISKCREFNKVPITEGWLNAISRAFEAIARIEGKAQERMVLMSGIETAAEEILSKNK